MQHSETEVTSKRSVTLSLHDEIQAQLRHPDFKKELAAWTDLFNRERQPGFRPTKQDERRIRHHSSSPWSSLAEMEASRYKWLSLQEKWQRRIKHDHPVITARRTLDPTLNGDTIAVSLPLKQPISRTLQMVEILLKGYREGMGIEDSQPLKRTKIDPWLVWDEYIGNKKSFVKIAQELTGIAENPNYNRQVKRVFDQVCRAYRQAQRMIKIVEPAQ